MMPRIFKARVVLAAVLMTAGAWHPLEAQNLESLGSGVAWRVSQDVTAGSVSVRVLTGSGQPLEGAMVQLAGADGGAGLTDAEGTFELSPPFAGTWELRITMIGYPRTREEILVPWDYGVLAVAVLQPISYLCHSVVCRGTVCSDLNIRVIDSTTERPPTGEVTVRIEHEEGRVMDNTVELRPAAPPYGSVGLGRSIEEPGFYNITVLADGYEPWTIEQVYLQLVPGCTPKLLNRDHVARLRPSM
jgi:hypothetical protein